jgi:hypothetical protein
MKKVQNGVLDNHRALVAWFLNQYFYPFIHYWSENSFSIQLMLLIEKQ